MANLKARVVQYQVIEGPDAATVQAALEAWRATAGEKGFLSAQLAGAGSTFMVLILYTAG